VTLQARPLRPDCQACGQIRPIELIAVRSTVVRTGPPGPTIIESVRHCADRPACQAAAADIHWLPAVHGGPGLNPDQP